MVHGKTVAGRNAGNLLTDWGQASMAQAAAASYLALGLYSYTRDFFQPMLAAGEVFARVEAQRLPARSPAATWEAYLQLGELNWWLFGRQLQGTMASLSQYAEFERQLLAEAMEQVMVRGDCSAFVDYCLRHEETMRKVVEEYPREIERIEPEFGFHFERDPQSLIAETERFTLRRVLPSQPGVEIDAGQKPVLIIPPFVLGANILAFLPGEGKSYAHSFANRGIPTYVRILKDIHTNPAVQTMDLDDDAKDTGLFCEQIKLRHGRPVTLNGYCQGGYSALCALLAGGLDGLADALITCVAPIDGTRSKGLGEFLRHMPQAFNDLEYGGKRLASGRTVASGELMGWVYKLKSMEQQAPLVSLINNILLLTNRNTRPPEINKTVAALNHWLQNERTDLPLAITAMSHRAYTVPIAGDGTLPVRLFGRPLNLRALAEKNIAWLICYGESDDLVEKEVALAPLDWLSAEVTAFPKGHVAIATSWSRPGSAYPLDGVIGPQRQRGPVRFHLDIAGGGQAGG